MKNKREILVPLDDTAHAQRTLERACEIAKQNDSKINILQVIEIRGADGFYGNYQRARERERGEKVQTFKQVESYLDSENVEYECHMQTGLASEIITNFAKDGTYDMIVMGRHGQSFLDKIFRTSTSDYVTQNAPCDVLVVK